MAKIQSDGSKVSYRLYEKRLQRVLDGSPPFELLKDSKNTSRKLETLFAVNFLLLRIA